MQLLSFSLLADRDVTIEREAAVEEVEAVVVAEVEASETVPAAVVAVEIGTGTFLLSFSFT